HEVGQCYHANQAGGGAEKQKLAAIRDTIADKPKRNLHQDIAKPDHREEKRCIGFRITDTCAEDRKEGETAGFHSTEYEDGHGGGWNSEDEGQEGDMLTFLEIGTVTPCDCNRYDSDYDDGEADIEGQSS